MLPVSGAAQLSAAGARWPLRPVISASGAYCRLVSPAPCSPGRKRFHRPRRRASARSSASDRHRVPGPRVVELRRAARGRPARPGRRGSSMKSSSRCAQLLGLGVEREVHQSVLLQCALRPAASRGWTASPIVVEAGADGLALEVAVVDALEDHGELERGEAEVEAQAGQVAAAAPRRTARDARRRWGSRAPMRASATAAAARHRGEPAGRPAAAPGRSAGRRAWPSPSRGPRLDPVVASSMSTLSSR